jgi:hypothetical protein
MQCCSIQIFDNGWTRVIPTEFARTSSTIIKIFTTTVLSIFMTTENDHVNFAGII